MPDITMCRGVGCKLAETCYRSPASGTKPNELRQSWFFDEPFWSQDNKMVVCDCYWKVEKKVPRRESNGQAEEDRL
jgi:hypothetical protein